MKVTHRYDPWHCLEVEDFLPPDRFEEIKKLAMIEYAEFERTGVNSVYTDHKTKDYTSRSKYTRFLTEDIVPETNQFFEMLPEHRGYTGELKKLVHWAITPENFNYPTHIDNASRINTCTYYIWPEYETGTILCKNPSKNDDGDHVKADEDSDYEVEVEWKPNKLFVHNSVPNKTWHRYASKKPRIVLSVFLVQPDLIRSNRNQHQYLLDL
jgi:hypothetical protein|tara:strand:+ start:127 stop:759 length:633 start_codon:yes stop_codon:yes gene_type:complete